MLKRVVSAAVIGYFLVGIVGCSCSRPNPPPEKIPGLYLESARVSEGNSGTQALNFKVVLSPVRSAPVTVDYELVNVSAPPSPATEYVAVADADFTSVVKGTVTFAPNEEEKIIAVSVLGDTLYERSELLQMQISNANGAEIIVADALGEIVNDDLAPVAKLELLETGDTATQLTETPGDKRNFKLSLNTASGLPAPVLVSWSQGEKDATATTALINIDYVADKSSVEKRANSIAIPAGETTTEFAIETVDDGKVEATETFYVEIAVINADASVDINSFRHILTITDNDVDASALSKPLNDTGIDYVLGGSYASVAAQLDGSQGRDASATASTLTKVGGGIAGFDFTRIDSNGQELTDTTKTFDQQPWSCVRDNHTKLIWERKLTDPTSFRAANSTRGIYWYDPEVATNGGDAGVEGDSVDCVSGTECNTAYYVARINLMKLCGLTGWRMPSLEELRSIANYANTSTSINAFDETYFTHLGSISKVFHVWSSNTLANDRYHVWGMAYNAYPVSEPVRKALITQTAFPMLVNDQLVKQ